MNIDTGAVLFLVALVVAGLITRVVLHSWLFEGAISNRYQARAWSCLVLGALTNVILYVLISIFYR